MKNNMWQAYQAGQAASVLPAGFMQAATEPGRALATGLGNFGMQMAQGFREMKEREERQKEAADKARKEAQEAKQEFNRLVEKLSDGTKTTRDRLQTMGIGELQGIEARQEMERQQMAEAQRTAIMQENLNLAKDAALMRQQVFEQGQRKQADTADILRFAAVGRGIGLTDEDILAAAASGQSSFRDADLPTLMNFLQQVGRSNQALGLGEVKDIDANNRLIGVGNGNARLQTTDPNGGGQVSKSVGVDDFGNVTTRYSGPPDQVDKVLAGQPVKPPPTPEQQARANRLAEVEPLAVQLHDDILKLQQEIDAGNRQPGPDWIPLVKTNADRLKAKAAELDKLYKQYPELKAAKEPAANPGAVGDKVRVVRPDGQPTWIRAEQLDQALKQGYRKVD